MSIRVRFPPYLQKFTGGRESVESSGQNIGEVLNNLEIQFPGIKQQLCDKQGRLFSFYDIYINSESSYPEELDKPVNDGDEVAIMILLGGG